MKYITRKKKNNKFIYVDEKNVEIKNKDILNKISKIYIAPAYTDVRIFPNSNDLLAYGYDDAGRKQYVYSESFKLKRENKKYCKLIKLCNSMDVLKKKVEKDLLISYFTKEKMLEKIQIESEHFAKRQMTWFKKDKKICWINNLREAVGLIDIFLDK